ncbi:MAG: ABC transporter substrate-binding protein, partial [Bacillota bacterium]|nr:ABC transporter substrate-binding protein [Bacillota bacterium]
ESDTLTAKILTTYIVDEAKINKIAIIHMTDQYGTGGKDNMVTALKAKGITPVTIQAHNAGDKDFSAQMLAMKKVGAQAMVIFSGATDNGIILKQAKQLIPEIKIFQSSVGATKPVMDVAGAAANGTYAVVTYTQDNPDAKVQKFVAAFKKKYNSDPPDFFAPLSYDAVYMIAEALKKANTNDHEKFRDAFRAIKGFGGASGLSYSVAPNGETVSELLLVQIKDGKHTVVGRIKL